MNYDYLKINNIKNQQLQAHASRAEVVDVKWRWYNFIYTSYTNLQTVAMYTCTAGLHDNDLHEPVLARRPTRLLSQLRRQHDVNRRLRREDLGSRHVLRQRQAFLPARRHREEQNDPSPRWRIDRLRNEVGYIYIYIYIYIRGSRCCELAYVVLYRAIYIYVVPYRAIARSRLSSRAALPW